MIRKIALWTVIVVLIGVGLFALGRASNNASNSRRLPSFSLSSSSAGMISSGPGYMYDLSYSDANPTTEDVITEVQRFLDRIDDPDLTVARLREFTYAYQVEVIECSTGRHVFGLMLGKGTLQISPKAGPNIFWNTKYGSMIAKVGGGYGMLGRLISFQPTSDMPLTEPLARAAAEDAIKGLDADLELVEGVRVYYGFYEYNLSWEGELVGEIDVNG